MKILHHRQSSCGQIQTLGPYQIESLVFPAEEGAFTAYRVRIEPGQETSESYHKIAEECYYVIEGAGVAFLDDCEYALEAGDFLRLPPGTRHRFTTSERPLVMLDLHSPGSRPDRDVYFTGEAPDGFTAED
jgi:mannose-6-phosphate isomerase-like protein (cupin superfamily)